jgi:SAM-dependent methyltransferase
MRSQRDEVVDQFTQQAVPFSMAPGIRDDASLQLLVGASGVTASDRVLDVACGPGLVVRAFAGVARQVTGIDVTPAMIERARELTDRLANVSLEIGDVLPLPYADEAFDRVSCRYAFHHFPRPGAVLREMLRVCRRGGGVVVCDLLASEDPDKAEAFHRVEMQRDPSHVRALTLRALEALFVSAGLVAEIAARYRLPFELDGLMARSFPVVDREHLKQAYVNSIEGDALGLNLTRVGQEVHGAYDVAILRAVRMPDSAPHA